MIYDEPDNFADSEKTISRLFKRAQLYAKENALQWTFSKDKFQKDFKKEFSEFHKKTRVRNIYIFPPRKDLIKILLTKRSELMKEYIPDEEAELVPDSDDEAEKKSLDL